MESFWRKSKTGIRDWTKIKFMRGDIHEFIDTISGYKSTISVGLGTLNIHNAKVTQEVLKQYNGMIQDTSYNLDVHLQRIDEKMERVNNDSIRTSDSTIGLDDEREVTKQCLRVCEDARHYIESLANRKFSLLQNRPQDSAKDNEQDWFEAQLIARQALNENHDKFSAIINQLRDRLESLVLKNKPGDEKERSRLREDINTSMQCLEVCKAAKEVSRQKIYRVGEVIADGDSDQVVVTTLA
ncbi:hypothetical protein AnigIFM50267_002386 [Aspergillus niger]|nr:hypothetical protein AnigIFM50267_002386 [Aspergillus niger]